MSSSARVLLVGSHPAVTALLGASLERAGWSTVVAVGPDEGVQAIAQHPVDAMVLGGPTALGAREELVEALRRRWPWAVVVVPDGPDRVLQAVAAAFGAPQ